MNAALNSADLAEHLLAASATTLEQLRAAHLSVVTAESCTGGLIAAALTHHAGSSVAVIGGFVTYANSMKQEQLGVSGESLARWGAVSEQVAREMTDGALRAAAEAALAVSVTGIAGPDGGSDEKPIGLVWFGIGRRDHETRTMHRIFSGDRTQIRLQAALYALTLIESAVNWIVDGHD